jgi:hypothetical protein
MQTLGHKMLRVDPASSACSAQPPEDPPAEHVPSSSASAGEDKEFVISSANSLQALLFLSNLMHANADDPAKVRLYVHLVEQRLQALGKLVCPMLWNCT